VRPEPRRALHEFVDAPASESRGQTLFAHDRLGPRGHLAHDLDRHGVDPAPEAAQKLERDGLIGIGCRGHQTLAVHRIDHLADMRDQFAKRVDEAFHTSILPRATDIQRGFSPGQK
jgi:hypothetical protein